jgi:hypothetical protein
LRRYAQYSVDDVATRGFTIVSPAKIDVPARRMSMSPSIKHGQYASRSDGGS